MEQSQKHIIWNIIEKYEGILDNLCNSLSRILQNKNFDDDYLIVYSNYRNIDNQDSAMINNIIGNKLILILNK